MDFDRQLLKWTRDLVQVVTKLKLQLKVTICLGCYLYATRYPVPTPFKPFTQLL